MNHDHRTSGLEVWLYGPFRNSVTQHLGWRISSQGLQQISVHIAFRFLQHLSLTLFQNWLKNNGAEHKGHAFPSRTFNIPISLVSFNPLMQCFYHPVLKNRLSTMKEKTRHKRIRRWILRSFFIRIFLQGSVWRYGCTLLLGMGLAKEGRWGF